MDKEKLEKIWKDWEAFASYAFNKSHSTCYAWIAYQTAYLKAHYPAEYMAAVLSNNMNDIKQVTFFMEECKRMKLKVLGPDVNESLLQVFSESRKCSSLWNGCYQRSGTWRSKNNCYEQKRRMDLTSLFLIWQNVLICELLIKKRLRTWLMRGALIVFDMTHRAQYFSDEGDGVTFLEKTIRYANKYQENKNSAQVSLFGEASDVQIA